MTISLTQEQKNRLRKLIDAGRFESTEHFINYALYSVDVEDALFEDEAYSDYLRGLLEESQKAVEEGRVRTYTGENHHELTEDIERRGLERLKASKQQVG